MCAGSQRASEATFDLATEVTRSEGGDPTRGAGAERSWWAGELPEGWDVGGTVNGGMVLAVAASALRAETGRPDPLSVTVHYLDRAAAGPVEVGVEVLRAGRTRHTAEAAVRQGGAEVARALAVLGEADGGAAPQRWDADPPALPPPEECVAPVRGPQGLFEPPPITENVALRLRPEHAGFALGRPPGVPVIHAWARLADGREPDTLALGLFADALPPVVFNAGLPLSWVPTLELTVHVRARPAPGWVRIAGRTRLLAGGYLDEEADVWDADGRLVATARQLALAPREPGP